MKFLLVLGVLRLRRARTAVVFHDVHLYGGERFRDRARRFCQRWVMHFAYRGTARTILTSPPNQACWLPAQAPKAVHIPIGANVPAMALPAHPAGNGRDPKTIVVFGVTDDGDIRQEVGDIALAARRAAERLPHVRLVTVGRGSTESQNMFRQALRDSRVEFEALGVLSGAQVSQALASADVALFVRGPISTHRGTAIASISNGIPLVAYALPSLPAPLLQAGLEPVRYRDREKLAEATVRVLTDPQLWSNLHERSRRAYEKYFSWEAVASRYLEVFRDA
jgi:glycosyltransferase involved in cell wall biosynthesis